MESLAKEQMAGLAEKFDDYQRLLENTYSFSDSAEFLDELMDTLKKMESLPTRNIGIIQTGAVEHVDRCLLTNALLEECEKNPDLDLSSVSRELRNGDPGYAQREVERARKIKRKVEGFAEKLSGCSSYDDFSSFLLDFFNYEYPGNPFGWGNDFYNEYVFRKALLSKIGDKEAGKLAEKIRGFIKEEVKRRTQKGIDFIEALPESRRIREFMGEDIYGDCKTGADYRRRKRAEEIEILKPPRLQDFGEKTELYDDVMHFLPSLRQKMLEQSPVSEKEAEAWFNKNVSIQCPARAGAKREEVAESVKLFYRLTGGKLPDNKKLAIQVNSRNKRAYARPERGLIVLGKNSSPATVMHELGHILDENNLNQNLLPRFLIRERATGAPQKLTELVENRNYDKYEIAYPDTFNHPYVGKIYDRSASEVTSMFFTFLFLDTANFDYPKMSIMLDLSHSGLIMDLILDKNPPTMVKGYNGGEIKTLLTPYMPKKVIQKISKAFDSSFYKDSKLFYSILGFAPVSTSVGERMIWDVVGDKIFLGSCGARTAEIILLLIYMYSIGCREFPFRPSKMRTIAGAVNRGTPPDWFVDWCCEIDEDDFIRVFERDTVKEIKKKNSARPQLYKVLKTK